MQNLPAYNLPSQSTGTVVWIRIGVLRGKDRIGGTSP